MTVYTNAVTYKGPYVVYANKITQDKSWSLQKDKSHDQKVGGFESHVISPTSGEGRGTGD